MTTEALEARTVLARIHTPGQQCRRCRGVGVVQALGTSLDRLRGVRVVDPQECDDVSCPVCDGSGWAR